MGEKEAWFVIFDNVYSVNIPMISDTIYYEVTKVTGQICTIAYNYKVFSSYRNWLP